MPEYNCSYCGKEVSVPEGMDTSDLWKGEYFGKAPHNQPSPNDGKTCVNTSRFTLKLESFSLRSVLRRIFNVRI